MSDQAARIVQLQNTVAAYEACVIAPHHYRFEQNGAELLREDLDTGEVCQLSANKLWGWRFPSCRPTSAALPVCPNLADKLDLEPAPGVTITPNQHAPR